MKLIANSDKNAFCTIPKRTECCNIQYQTICRLTNISCIATFLRSVPLNNLKEEERTKFLEFQTYFIDLESKCFEEAYFE